MSKIYAVAIDAFCNCKSVRGAYTVVKAPINDETLAIAEANAVITNLESKYKTLETNKQNVEIKSIDAKTKILIKNEEGNKTPLLRCSVIGVEDSPITTAEINNPGSGEAIKQYQRRLKKINQYIATLTPQALSM